MNVYLLEFNGHYLGGEMIVIDETKRKALNKAKKELEDRGLLNKNKDLTLQDMQEIQTDKRLLLVLNDGDY
ncbi:hypothetical protein AB1L07_02080 [Niallia alba]|uniref:hypothetical protein n=1 Tax=Niallia alba TaxID=2729105 RepID=UPI0039A3E45E